MSNKKIKLGIALQGGGSYGAYAKGVLKTLFNAQAFQSPNLEIKAVSGTSAGAVNGALISAGLNTGGPKLACTLLDRFWHDVGINGQAANWMSGVNSLTTPGWPNLPYSATALMRFAPPGYLSRELKSMMEKHVPDWNAVRNGPVKLFVNAVQENPKTKQRLQVVFTGKALTPDTVAASGALQEFGPHEIGGNRFYDGAYWRNPCFEDILKEDITDLLVVTLQAPPPDGVTPVHQDEMRQKLTKPGFEVMTGQVHNHLAYIHQQNPQLNLHVISLQADPRWDRTSRMNADPAWLAQLEKTGEADARKWLKEKGHLLGQKSSYEAPSAPVPGIVSAP